MYNFSNVTVGGTTNISVVTDGLPANAPIGAMLLLASAGSLVVHTEDGSGTFVSGGEDVVQYNTTTTTAPTTHAPNTTTHAPNTTTTTTAYHPQNTTTTTTATPPNTTAAPPPWYTTFATTTVPAERPAGQVAVLINVSGVVNGDCVITTSCPLQSCRVAVTASSITGSLGARSDIVSWLGQHEFLASGGTVAVSVATVGGFVIAHGDVVFLPNGPGLPPLHDPRFLPLSSSLLRAGNALNIGTVRGDYFAQTNLFFGGQALSSPRPTAWLNETVPVFQTNVGVIDGGLDVTTNRPTDNDATAHGAPSPFIITHSFPNLRIVEDFIYISGCDADPSTVSVTRRPETGVRVQLPALSQVSAHDCGFGSLC